MAAAWRHSYPLGRSRFNVGEQGAIATRRIALGGICQIAIQLLPHLIEAMDRARGVVVVKESAAIGDLKWSGEQILNIGDACIGSFTLQTRATAGQKVIVLRARQTSFRNFRAFSPPRVAGVVPHGLLPEKYPAGPLGPGTSGAGQDVKRGKFLGWRRSAGRWSVSKAQKLLRLVEVGTGDRVLVGIHPR